MTYRIETNMSMTDGRWRGYGEWNTTFATLNDAVAEAHNVADRCSIRTRIVECGLDGQVVEEVQPQ